MRFYNDFFEWIWIYQNLDFISTFNNNNNNNNNNKWNSVFDHLEISGKLEYNIASKLGTKYVASCGWTRDWVELTGRAKKGTYNMFSLEVKSWRHNMGIKSPILSRLDHHIFLKLLRQVSEWMENIYFITTSIIISTRTCASCNWLLKEWLR
jgi:hypothetical protein